MGPCLSLGWDMFLLHLSRVQGQQQPVSFAETRSQDEYEVHRTAWGINKTANNGSKWRKRKLVSFSVYLGGCFRLLKRLRGYTHCAVQVPVHTGAVCTCTWCSSYGVCQLVARKINESHFTFPVSLRATGICILNGWLRSIWSSRYSSIALQKAWTVGKCSTVGVVQNTVFARTWSGSLRARVDADLGWIFE